MDLASGERIQSKPRIVEASRPGKSRRRAIVATVAGLAMVVAWGAWWGESIAKGRLVSGRLTWVECLPFLAGDFVVHVEPEARIQAAGGNPYDVKNGWYCAVSPYPPMVYRTFAWVSLMTPKSAAIAWLLGIQAMIAAGAWGAWRSRNALEIGRIPYLPLLGLILFSAPVVYALERGQTDPIVLGPILLACFLLKLDTKPGDFSAGAILGMAAWLKYYPGLMILGLIAMGRRRSVAAFLIVAGLIGLVDREGFRTSMDHARTVSRGMIETARSVHICSPMQHSLSLSWPIVWGRTHAVNLARIPGNLASAALLIPIVSLACFRVYRSRDRTSLGYPLMLWLTAVATFALPYSNDYNLVFLPIAALAACDRRDRPIVFMLLGFFAMAWQPLWLPVDGKIILASKLAGLYAVGLSLAARASEKAEIGREPVVPGPHFEA